MKYTLTVNGMRTVIEADDPNMPLLYALRNDLGLHGPRFGCGLGQCGACTVHVDGKAARSCSGPVSTAANRKVTTLEGLGTPGQLMSAAAMLDEPWGDSDDEVREAMAGNICRCGAYQGIVAAIQQVRAFRPSAG